jgi:DNA-binding MurR/RpiR family transcriptional regulator
MSTNPLDRIQSYYDELTNKDKDIAVYIINNPKDACRSSIDGVAKRAGTSKSALVRFANRIGYSGFAELKYDLSRFLVSANSGTDEENKDPVRSICDTYASYISRMAEAIDPADLDAIAAVLIKARRIKIFGFNRTFNSAMQMRQRLAKIGIDAEAVADTTLMTDYEDICTPDDCVIVFTISDNGGFYKPIVTAIADNRCPVFCFTMSQALPFKKKCEKYIVLPRISRDSSISFLDDQAVFMVFIEILMNNIAANLSK